VGRVIRAVEEGIEKYRFNEAAHELYHFVWHEFCDWYLEMIKPVLYQAEDTRDRQVTRLTLLRSFAAILRLAHPFMPFVSEKLWQTLMRTKESILQAGFPEAADFPEDPSAEDHIGLVQGLIYEIRNIRGEMNISPSKNVEIWLRCPEPVLQDLIQGHQENVLNLTRGATLNFLGAIQGPPDTAVSGVYRGIEIFIPLKDILQFEEELKRLEKEIQKTRKEWQQAEKKLSNEDFLQKAPAEVILKEKEKVQVLGKKMEKLEGHVKRLKALMA
jgi:valyl-tRNA synthetase